MRLHVLDRGHTLGKKALFALIRVMTRLPVPDIMKVLVYRPDFFGTPMRALVHEAMRAPSEWTVAEREMMASYVSKANECEF